jgi:hypothetical protein
LDQREGAHRQEEYRYLTIAFVKKHSKMRAGHTTGIRLLKERQQTKQLKVNKNAECFAFISLLSLSIAKKLYFLKSNTNLIQQTIYI